MEKTNKSHIKRTPKFTARTSLNVNTYYYLKPARTREYNFNFWFFIQNLFGPMVWSLKTLILCVCVCVRAWRYCTFLQRSRNRIACAFSSSKKNNTKKKKTREIHNHNNKQNQTHFTTTNYVRRELCFSLTIHCIWWELIAWDGGTRLCRTRRPF